MICALILVFLPSPGDCGNADPQRTDPVGDANSLQYIQLVKNMRVQIELFTTLIKDIIDELNSTKATNCDLAINIGDRLSTILNKVQKGLPEDLQQAKTSIGLSYGSINREHELLRRKLENGIQQFWYHQRSQFKEMIDSKYLSDASLNSMTDIQDAAASHYRVTMADIHKLASADGSEILRKAELDELSDVIQHRFQYVQNPANCSTSKRLVCILMPNKCGYGCTIHHLIDCMTVAYATRRVVLLDSAVWFADQQGWQTVFQPISGTCSLDDAGDNTTAWAQGGDSPDIDVVVLERNQVAPRKDYLPMAIPSDIADKLIRLHGQPGVWWLGQIFKYLFRPQPSFEKQIKDFQEEYQFSHPIVGVHVRRTDKLTREASYHSIEEYMEQVEEYYKLLELEQTVDTKRVYLASDDASVLKEAEEKYPDYKFISNRRLSHDILPKIRIRDEMVTGIILDIHFLSRSDFLVCTFSSNVCRLAYEMMQAFHSDASNFFYSVDRGYFTSRQSPHRQRAIYNYTAKDDEELSLQSGDVLNWNFEANGSITGQSQRLKKKGKYYRYMVEDITRVSDFTSYTDVDLLRNT